MSVRITCHGRSHFLQRPIHHAHLFRIVIPDIASEVIGDMLSGLSTVEEPVGESIQKSQRHNQLCGLLRYIQRLKIVRVLSEWRSTSRVPFS